MRKILYKPIDHCGRTFSAEQVAEIVETVNMFKKLSVSELSKTICEHLQWYTPAGTNKAEAGLKLLEKLESKGYISLPERKEGRNTKKQVVTVTDRTLPEAPIVGRLKDLPEITVEVVDDPDTKKLWMEYLARYHYLEYKRPFGFYMQYFIKMEERHLGCVLFSGPARWVKPRDNWIGWTDEQRINNQSFLINNNRFLIFPWVNIKYMASHVLGKIERRVVKDYHRKWGYRPVLMETFVDLKLYHGTCYKASNWEYLGTTTGIGLARKGRNYISSPKLIFMRPLSPDFRQQLCSEDYKKGRKTWVIEKSADVSFEAGVSS